MSTQMKRTIAGWLPVDWDAALIKTRCNVVRGASPRPAGDPRYFEGDYLPWITVADVTGISSIYLTSTRSKLTQEGAKYTRIIPAGTLILSNSGATLGVPKITAISAGANDGIAMFLEPQGLLKEFMYFFLESKTEFFRSDLAPGVGQPNLNTDLIGGVSIPVPPVEEQSRIAELLTQWNSAIEKIEQVIAAKQRLKSGLMSRLLTGKLRLNRFNGSWRNASLGELFQERVETNWNDLQLLSITGENGVVRRSELNRKDSSNDDKSKYLRICPGDIGYNTMRMWQGVSALSPYEGIISPAYTVCIPSPEIDGTFASYLFKLPEVIHLFYRYSQGLTSDTWNLKFQHFAEVRVCIPDLDEQIAIASVLSGLDSELAIRKQQCNKLRQQKRGMMQKLLTGQWRVPVASKEAAA